MKRDRLSKGIYKDTKGIIIRIHVRGEPVDHRHDSEKTPYIEHYRKHGIQWLRDERIRLQAAATLQQERRDESSKGFAADVPRFLNTIDGARWRMNVSGYMKHWATAFSTTHRNDITDIQAQTAYAAIQKSAATKRHLRDALVHFYECLNGKSGYNPGRALVPPPKEKAEARALSYTDIIEPIFNALPPSKSRARLMVIAYTSLPHSLIKKIQKHHLRLKDAEIVVSPRRKGRGVPARTLPLSAKGIEALTEFDRLHAYGSFQNRQLMGTLKYGAKLAQVELPPTARPYDLRHSFLTEVYRQTGDLRAVSELGMHATLEQTSRYASGAVSERATKAIASVPRFSNTTKAAKAPKRSNSRQSNTGKTGANNATPTPKKRRKP